MDKTLISIVVPVYNTSEYLQECLSSLLKQSLKEFEIICVDDCSTDNSSQIINNMQLNDSRIKLIQNEHNSGVSFSRNTGLSASVGEYVYFLDSDDYLEEGALDILYKKASECDADLVFMGAYKYYSKNNKLAYDSPFGYEAVPDEECLDLCKMPIYMNGAAWWYIVRRKLLMDNLEVRFPIGVHPHEDTAFSFMLLSIINSYTWTRERLINYRQHSRMVMSEIKTTKRAQNINSIILSLDTVINFSKLHPEIIKKRKHALDELVYSFTRKNMSAMPIRILFFVWRARLIKLIYRKKVTTSGYIQIKIFKIPVYRKKSID